jgi:hypothetical protein
MAFMGIFLTMPLLVLLTPIMVPIALMSGGWSVMHGSRACSERGANEHTTY